LSLRDWCLLLLLALPVSGQQRAVSLQAPYGPAKPLISPDGANELYGSDAAECQLWLEDRRTHRRRPVFRVTLQTLTLAWSPDGAAFLANDRAASDVEVAWLYDVRTLERLDLRRLIVAADPVSAKFVGPSIHSYVHAVRWLDAGHVEVRLFGHTNGERVGDAIRPGQCFDLRYRIGRDGAVRKLSEHVGAIGANGCPEEEEQ
jgi:hypothetical protein